jgi:hypothetical protein
MVDGSHVAQRCLRCGAIVEEGEVVEPAAEAATDAVPTRRLEPQPSQLPPAPVERPAEAGQEAMPEDDGAQDGEGADAATLAALSALRELGELHASGVLTDREFARKKAELLRRV